MDFEHGSIRLGIVTALAVEARCLTPKPTIAGELMELFAGVALIRAGIGPDRAVRAARKLVARGAGALAGWGVAGGLSPALAPGTLVLPDRILGRSGQTFECDAVWRDRLRKELSDTLRCERGTIVESREPVASRELKAALHIQSNAVAVDMESAAVAAVALDAGVPFIAVRAVSDPASESLPASAVGAMSSDGEIEPARLIGAVIRRPRELPGLLRVARHFSAAKSTLEAVARRAGYTLMVR